MKLQNRTIFLIIFLICILATLIFYVPDKFTASINNIFARKTYYKCNKTHNPPTQNILDTENFKHQSTISSLNQPDLYIPCKYSNAELELYNLPKEKVANSKIFAISGCDILAGKDSLWRQLEETYSRDGAKLLMPETYLTNSAIDLDLFERSYHVENIYILKKNIQRKEGIIILNNLLNILATIKRDPRYIIIQHYITNPFLIQKRKLNIRLYIAVVCEPSNKTVRTYLYTKGKCIYTNQDYDPKDINKLEAHLTSLNLNTQIYSKVPESLTQLAEYIGAQEYKTIWAKIIYKMSKIMQAMNPVICQDGKGTVNFQLFGADIMLDQNLEPWVLEFNKGPDMSYKTLNDKKMKTQLYQDLFCLVGLADEKKCNLETQKNWISIL